MSSKVLRSRSKANDSDVVDTESPAKKQRTINNSQKGGDYDPDFAKDDGIDGAEDKNTGKSSRSEAGKKAAETRRRNAANKSNQAQDDKQSDEDDRSNNQSEKHTQGGTHEQHVEAGKKGAEARWGNHDDSSDQSKHVQGGTHEQHVEAGKKEAEVRWGKHDDSSDSNQHQSNDQSNQSTKHTQGGTHEQHVEAGKKGAEARSGKHDDSSDSNQHESKHVQGGTHEQHVEAGKKGAEARWGKHGDSSSDSKGKDEAKKIMDELSKDKKIQQLKDKQNAERDNEIKECEQLISQAMKQSSKPDLALMLKPEGKNLIQVIRMEHRLVEQLGEKLTSLLKQSNDKAIKTAALGMAFNIMKLLSIHAACEEMVLYPMLKSKGHDALVKHALHEHTEMKRDLVELNEIFNDPNDIFDNPDRKDFITKLRKCLDDTLHHVEEEEESLLPLVESLNSKAELAEMLDQFLKGHEKSPSRPHVDAPAEPPANIKANAEAAQLDMMMDIDQGRFDVPSK